MIQFGAITTLKYRLDGEPIPSPVQLQNITLQRELMTQLNEVLPDSFEPTKITHHKPNGTILKRTNSDREDTLVTNKDCDDYTNELVSKSQNQQGVVDSYHEKAKGTLTLDLKQSGGTYTITDAQYDATH